MTIQTHTPLPDQSHEVPQAPYYVKALALGIPAYLIGVHLWTWVFNFSTFANGNADFRQLYTAGYMVRSGYAHQLYNYDVQLRLQSALVSPADLALPFIRPAYEALLFVPLSFITYRSAYLVTIAINILLLATCYWLLRSKMQNLASVYSFLPAAMFLAFLPIAAALIQGQDSILLLTIFAAAVVLLHRKRDLAAGALVGLGLFKLQIVIPAALIFLIWHRWRFSLGFALSASLATAASVWVVGTDQAIRYMRSLAVMSVSPSSNAHPFRYAIPVNRMPNLHGLLFGCIGKLAADRWVSLLSVLLSAVMLVVVAWRYKANTTENGLLVATTVSTLSSYYLLIHDLSIMLVPIVIMLDRFIASEATGEREGRLIVRAAALLFVAPLCMSYSPEHFYLVALPLSGFLVVLIRPGAFERTAPIQRVAVAQ